MGTFCLDINVLNILQWVFLHGRGYRIEFEQTLSFLLSDISNRYSLNKIYALSRILPGMGT